ncbi:MAG: hypothetical protein D6752_07060 [Candidatus Nitrosothermus koennekii]|nr:MAG: hypothetical protein D6752_07060 [Candidatus Nitrosothermus koennekii]
MFSHYSPSKFDSWRYCKQKFFQIYIEESEPLFLPSYMALGTTIDKTICDAFETDEWVDEIWLEERAIMYWDKIYEGIIPESKKQANKKKKLIPEICHGPAMELYQRYKEKALETQVELKIEVDNNLPPIMGVIDIVMESSLADMKVTSQTWSKGSEKMKMQPYFYSLYLFEKDRKLMETYFQFLIIHTGSMTLQVREVQVKRCQAYQMLQYMYYIMQDIDESVKRYQRIGDPKIFSGQIGGFQDYTCSRYQCPYWKGCEKNLGIEVKEK